MPFSYETELAVEKEEIKLRVRHPQNKAQTVIKSRNRTLDTVCKPCVIIDQTFVVIIVLTF